MASGAARSRDALVTFRVTLSGPFFTRDPKKTIRQNIRDMMDKLAPELEGAVRAQVEARQGSMPYYTGWTRDHIIGRSESIGGKDWWMNAVVSANTSGMSRQDAIRTKAAAASIERRWHPFRRVSSSARRLRAVLSADLTEGLN